MSDDTGFKPPKDLLPMTRARGEPRASVSSARPSPLPHWTEPATGEMPRLLFDEEPAAARRGPRGLVVVAAATPTVAQLRRRLGRRHRHRRVRRLRDAHRRARLRRRPVRERVRVRRHDRASDRSRAGGDADPHRESQRAPAPAPPRCSRRRCGSIDHRAQAAFPARPGSGGPAAPSGDRDLPVAIGVGVALAVVALVLFSIGPGAAMGLVTLVIAAAAAEFYAAMQKVGVPPGDAARHRRVRGPAPRDLLAGRGRDPARARAERRLRPALVPLRR